MKVIHLVLVVCCCMHSSFGVQRQRQPPAKWISNAAEPTMSTAPPKLANQARRGEEAQAKLNESNITLAPLVNSTQVVYTMENENGNDGKEYDHKHRVLLAMQSDVKVRDKVKQQEKLKSVAIKNNMPESRKRLKDGLKELILKLHTSHLNSDSSVEESEPSNGKTSNPSKSSRPLANIKKTRQRSAPLKLLECEDIPHSEALLHSAFLNDAKNVNSKTEKLKGQPTISADSIEDLPVLRKNLLKSRRNLLKMLPAYRGFPPFVWPPNATPYNHFNIHNPYNYFDCNYFLNPINEVGVPTIEYVWEDYEDAADSSTDNLLKKNTNSKE